MALRRRHLISLLAIAFIFNACRAGDSHVLASAGALAPATSSEFDDANARPNDEEETELDHVTWLGEKIPTRFSTVVLEWQGRKSHIHKSIDDATAHDSWSAAINSCDDGIHHACRKIYTWGKYGCAAFFLGQSDSGRFWVGHSLALLDPTYGNDAMKWEVEAARKKARSECDFHAHFDGDGDIDHPTFPGVRGYCKELKVVCSAPLQPDEFESPR